MQWAPTWHVITGTDKTSSWDAAVTAEPATQYTATGRGGLRIQVFRHNAEPPSRDAGAVINYYGIQSLGYFLVTAFALVRAAAHTCRRSA